MANYYVSLTGSNSNPGTLNAPWRSVYNATNINYGSGNILQPGDTIYVRGGTYYGDGISVCKSGISGNPITIMSYPGETATISNSTPNPNVWQGPNSSGVYWANHDSLTGFWAYWMPPTGMVLAYEPCLVNISGHSVTDSTNWWRSQLVTDTNFNYRCMDDLITPNTGLVWSGVYIGSDMRQLGNGYWDGMFMYIPGTYNGAGNGGGQLTGSGTRYYFRPPISGGSGPSGVWTLSDVQTRITFCNSLIDGIEQGTNPWAANWNFLNLKFLNVYDAVNGNFSGCVFSGLDFKGVASEGFLGSMYNCVWTNNSIDKIGQETYALTQENGNPAQIVGGVLYPYPMWNNSSGPQNQTAYGSMFSGISIYRNAGGTGITAQFYLDHWLGRDASGMPTGIRAGIIENGNMVWSGFYGKNSTLTGLLNDIVNIPVIGTYYQTGLCPGASGNWSPYYLSNTASTATSSQPIITGRNIYQTTLNLGWQAPTYYNAGGEWDHGFYLEGGNGLATFNNNVVHDSYFGSCQGECWSWRGGSGNLVYNNILFNQHSGGNSFEIQENNGTFSGNLIIGYGYSNWWTTQNLNFINNTIATTGYNMGISNYANPTSFSGFNFSNNIVACMPKQPTTYSILLNNNGSLADGGDQIQITDLFNQTRNKNIYWSQFDGTGFNTFLYQDVSQRMPAFTGILGGTGLGTAAGISYSTIMVSGMPAFFLAQKVSGRNWQSTSSWIDYNFNIDSEGCLLINTPAGATNAQGTGQAYIWRYNGVAHSSGAPITLTYPIQCYFRSGSYSRYDNTNSIADFIQYMQNGYGLESGSLNINPLLSTSYTPTNMSVSGMGSTLMYNPVGTTGVLIQNVPSKFTLDDGQTSWVTFGAKTVMISGSGTSLIWDATGTPQIVNPNTSFTVNDGTNNYVINRT